MNIRLSIILVHYKAADLLVNCVQSVYEKTNGISFEIIVVDNGPVSGLQERILKHYPAVRWIDMGYNAGFARANNAGIKQATGDFILLLNSDTIVHENSLLNAVERLSEDDAVGCGIQLLHADGNKQVSGNYFTKGGLNFLLPLPYIGPFVRWVGYTLNAKVPHSANPSIREEVDWINGAFLMVKAVCLSQSGLLDEDFFLYAEETEWCSRLRKVGKLVIYGDINITHLEGGSSQDYFGTHAKGYYSLTDKRGGQLMVSNLLRIRKQFGVAWFLILLFFYVIEFPVMLIGNIISIPFHLNQISTWLTEPFKYLKNILQLVSLSPKILSGKPYFYKVM